MYAYRLIVTTASQMADPGRQSASIFHKTAYRTLGCSPSLLALEWIDERDAQLLEIADVSRDYGEPVNVGDRGHRRSRLYRGQLWEGSVQDTCKK